MANPVIRAANFPADFEPIVTVLNAARPHHPRSVSELQHDWSHLEPELKPSFQVVELMGQVVGVTEWQRNASAFHPQHCSLELCVHPDAQRRGVGRLLWDAVNRELGLLEMQVVTVQVDEDHARGLRFAAQNDFRELKRDFESRLDLQRFDSSSFAAIKAQIAHHGVTLESWRQLDSAEFRRELHSVFSIVRLDVPRSAPATPISFEFFEQNILKDTELLWDASFVALKDTRIVGFTGAYRGGAIELVDQWLTAVTREMRGQHIALALKLKQLDALKSLGFQAVRTDNDTRNAAMLAVNHRLGFMRQGAVLVMQKDFAPQG